MKARTIGFATLCLGLPGLSGAAVVYSTSFEGGTGTPPYTALSGYQYVSYYGDGTVGAVNGSWTGAAGTLGDGWTVLGNNAGSASTGIDLVNTWNGVAPAPDGTQWIDLIGTPGPGGISRTFGVVAGATYTLTWDDFSNLGVGSAADSGKSYDVTFGSVNTVITAQNAWVGKTLSFTAAATGNATLEFYSADHTNGNTGIDALKVTSSVPEPVTLGLGAAAFLLGVGRRRRKD